MNRVPAPLQEIAAIQASLAWMREARIWPNGLRYLWTEKVLQQNAPSGESPRT